MIDFQAQLVPNLASQIDQNPSKIDARSHSILGSVFYRILIDFWCQLRPPETSKSWFFLKEKQGFYKKSPFEVDIQCLFDFGANLASFWSRSRSQEASKKRSILGSIFYRFWLRFGRQVGAMLATKMATKTAQDGIWEPESAQTPKMVPK